MSVRHHPIGVMAPEGTKFSWKRTFNRLGRLFTLVRPYRLCVPSSNNGEDPTAPDHAGVLLC